MVVNDKINTIDNQSEVIQPVEAEKSHLIPNEENHSNDRPFNSNDNLFEVIVPIDIVNSPSVPCVSNNDKNSSPGSIDSVKITTYHQSQIIPQISCPSKDELTRYTKTASVFESHACEDCIQNDAGIVNLKKQIINLEFLNDSLSDSYECLNRVKRNQNVKSRFSARNC